MKPARLYHSIRLLLCRNSRKRAKYLKDHKVLAGIGENCHWGPTLLPLYPELIKLHDNVTIHKTVKLMPHDVLNGFLMRSKPGMDLGPYERLGCIEIMDNVYLGIDCRIMPDVKINRNCVVSAGSVVTSDIPENSVVAGNPAKVIGRFDMYMAMRGMSKGQSVQFKNQKLPPELAEEQWKIFEKKRENTVK